MERDEEEQRVDQRWFSAAKRVRTIVFWITTNEGYPGLPQSLRTVGLNRKIEQSKVSDIFRNL
jgi:hypothetical protein